MGHDEIIVMVFCEDAGMSRVYCEGVQAGQDWMVGKGCCGGEC